MTANMGEVLRPRLTPERRQWHQHPAIRRLAGWLAAGVVLAIVTGPQGRTGEPSYSISQALKPAHLFTCILIALIAGGIAELRSEEHTSELQSHSDLVC